MALTWSATAATRASRRGAGRHATQRARRVATPMSEHGAPVASVIESVRVNVAESSAPYWNEDVMTLPAAKLAQGPATVADA